MVFSEYRFQKHPNVESIQSSQICDTVIHKYYWNKIGTFFINKVIQFVNPFGQSSDKMATTECAILKRLLIFSVLFGQARSFPSNGQPVNLDGVQIEAFDCASNLTQVFFKSFQFLQIFYDTFLTSRLGNLMLPVLQNVILPNQRNLTSM